MTSGHIGWADTIFVMEKKHFRINQKKLGEILIGKKDIILDISDDYIFMDEELMETLKSRVSEYIDLF